ncbi:MAG: Rrf2 family transcriptional regulator [Desulfobacterales bacterium]
MTLSQKCQYGLRAVFELSKRLGDGPIRIAEIAKNQAIPIRFLEVILNQLKQGGFVESRRGSAGGYMLSRSPATFSVGEIIRFFEGPLSPVQCLTDTSDETCPVNGGCAFLPLWEKVKNTVEGIYDEAVFEDLVQKERIAERASAEPDYSI